MKDLGSIDLSYHFSENCYPLKFVGESTDLLMTCCLARREELVEPAINFEMFSCC